MLLLPQTSSSGAFFSSLTACFDEIQVSRWFLYTFVLFVPALFQYQPCNYCKYSFGMVEVHLGYLTAGWLHYCLKIFPNVRAMLEHLSPPTRHLHVTRGSPWTLGDLDLSAFSVGTRFISLLYPPLSVSIISMIPSEISLSLNSPQILHSIPFSVSSYGHGPQFYRISSWCDICVFWTPPKISHSPRSWQV